MSPDPRTPDDKLEIHYRQQLSALVDGELAPDEARFLLRRLQHDTELSGSFERWQLGGDVLRGRVRRAAAPDLAERIAQAIIAEPAVAQSRPALATAGRRGGLVRWGGGAALAASVAAAALMVGGRQELPAPAAAPAAAVAVQALPATEARLATPPAEAPSAPRAAAVAALAVAAAPVAATAAQRRSPSPAAVVPEPVAVAATASLPVAADAAAPLAATDPFASATPLQARPWPRAVLSPAPGAGFTASFGEPAAPRPFYPFEPDLHAVPAPVDEAGGTVASPEDDGG